MPLDLVQIIINSINWNAVLKVCQVKLNPQVLVAQNKLLVSKNSLYPLWQSDIKTYDIQARDYEWEKEDIYRGVVPNQIDLALCSSEGFNSEPFNFYHYNLNCLDVSQWYIYPK